MALQTINELLWEFTTTSTTLQNMPAYQMVVGRPDGTPLISSLNLYLIRKHNTTNVYANGGQAQVFYQFFDVTGTALANKVGIVITDTVNKIITIAVPQGAYRFEVTATACSSYYLGQWTHCYIYMSLPSVNTSDVSSSWSFVKSSLTYDSAAPYTLTAKAPSIPYFSSSYSGSGVSSTISPLRGGYFAVGTYYLANYRDNYGYVKSGNVCVYNENGSSTNIAFGYGASINTTKNISVVVPAGTLKIVVSGVLYNTSSYNSTANFRFPATTTTPNYASASCLVTATAATNGLVVVPGFSPKPPTNPYKVFVAVGNDLDSSFIETDKVTATAGQAVYIKVELTADEPGTNLLSNICLVEAPTNIAVETSVDLSRVIALPAAITGDMSRTLHLNAAITPDTSRSLRCTDSIEADTAREITLGESVTIAADTFRHVVSGKTLAADLNRPTTQNNSDSMDLSRSVNKSGLIETDAVRAISATGSASIDSLRSRITSETTLFDTSRTVNKIAHENINMDLVRDVTVKSNEIITMNASKQLLSLYNSRVYTSMEPYRLVVARPDGNRLIRSINFYCYRKTGTVIQTTGTGRNKDSVQFFTVDGTALGDPVGIVVDPTNYLGSVAVPQGAYYAEITALVNADESTLITNVLMITSIDCFGYVAALDFTRGSLTFDAANPYQVSKSLPDHPVVGTRESFYTYVRPPQGDTFVAGTYLFNHYYDGYGTITNAIVKLYTANGAQYSSTSLPMVTSGSGYRGTNVVFPEGITKVMVSGDVDPGNSKIIFSLPTHEINYASAFYTIRTTKNVTNMRILPLCYPKPPSSAVRTFVSTTYDSENCYVETDRVTAEANKNIYIKVQLTANEPSISRIDSLCLAGNAGETIIAMADTKRSTAITTETAVEVDRYIVALLQAQAEIDLTKEVLVNQSCSIDSWRKTAVPDYFITDSNRRIGVRNVMGSDTFLRTLCSDIVRPDLSRFVTRQLSSAFDTKRCLGDAIRIELAMDTLRRIKAGVQVDSELYRAVLQSVTSGIDSSRRTSAPVFSQEDLIRQIARQSLIGFDMGRTIAAGTIAQIDTGRKTRNKIFVLTDTKRLPAAIIPPVYFDALRQINTADCILVYMGDSEVDIPLIFSASILDTTILVPNGTMDFSIIIPQ